MELEVEGAGGKATTKIRDLDAAWRVSVTFLRHFFRDDF